MSLDNFLSMDYQEASIPKPQITIANHSPKTWQKLYALATVFVPIVGTLCAIATSFQWGISSLAQ
jgi:hypothetical protein